VICKAFYAMWRQGEELAPVRGKAEQFGVTEIYIDDLREEFVRDFVFPMFRCASKRCRIVLACSRPGSCLVFPDSASGIGDSLV
jgi:argininosuccinate synthase